MTLASRRTAAVTLLAALALTGCSAVNYQATTHEYSGSDGVMFDVDDVQLRHITFVTSEQGAPARMLGLVNNGGQEPVEVELEIETDSFSVSLDPGEAVNLEHDEEFIVSSIGAAPGEMQEVTATVNGSTETFGATVLDGGMAEYRDLVPEGADEGMWEHLEHGPDTWGGGAAHHDDEE
ncbi:hypothetical protein [Nesterenkonia alba]|uniref:hypothetical protein n=1 Tax=Nesterenkonia alba TaxID=515814 RepID=UPI0003B6ECC9|nr:hypothetical protein [Nesterenkonia alba]